MRRTALAAAPRSPALEPVGRGGVYTQDLANGLRVILWPVHHIPNIALNLWVRAGSRNERPGITGLAHFLEHMMFNGTRSRGPGEFDRQMEAQGGASNAFTSDDVTVYDDWFPASATELVLDLEADRVANLAFVPELIETERGVVLSERRLRVEDNNHGLLAERVQTAAFTIHPYRFPTIGWPEDIRAWRLEDLQAFYRTYYAPNNLTLTLAGDFEPDDILPLVRRYFEPIVAQVPPTPVVEHEPQQLQERRVNLKRKVQTPVLQCAYKAPAANDSRASAIHLLLSTLIEGNASRLHRALVEERRVAIEVTGHWQEGLDPGLLWLSLTLSEGIDPHRALDALDEQLARVVADGVAQEALDRARNLAIVGFWKRLATIDGKAHLLGEYAVFHDRWETLFDVPERLEAVTREQVREAAADILVDSRRTLGILASSARRAQR